MCIHISEFSSPNEKFVKSNSKLYQIATWHLHFSKSKSLSSFFKYFSIWDVVNRNDGISDKNTCITIEVLLFVQLFYIMLSLEFMN